MKNDIDLKTLMEIKAARESPMEHQTIDLGIKEFKRRIRIDFPHKSKSFLNRAIALYKRKAWIDYKETVGYKGSFPTAPAY